MKRNRLGRTEVEVTELSFGCSGIGNVFKAVSDAEAQAVLDYAWDQGLRYFDTAPYYGRGRSEQRLGRFLQGRAREDYVLSTKVGRVLSPGQQLVEADGFVDPLPNDIRYDYTGDGVLEAFEQSCERLGTARIEVIFVHDLGEMVHGPEEAPRYLAQFLDSGHDALSKLKAQGRIGAFGLGVNENQVCLDVMAEAPLDVILLAGRLTLLDRSAETELVPLCAEAGTSLVLGGIFNSGILALGPVDGATYNYAPATPEILDQVRALQGRCDGLGVPMATAALKYAMQHPAAASVLLGTAKVSSLQRNLEACRAPVSTDLSGLFARP